MEHITTVEAHKRIKDRPGCGVCYATFKKVLDRMAARGDIRVFRVADMRMIGEADLEKIAAEMAIPRKWGRPKKVSASADPATV